MSLSFRFPYKLPLLPCKLLLHTASPRRYWHLPFSDIHNVLSRATPPPHVIVAGQGTFWKRILGASTYSLQRVEPPSRRRKLVPKAQRPFSFFGVDGPDPATYRKCCRPEAVPASVALSNKTSFLFSCAHVFKLKAHQPPNPYKSLTMEPALYRLQALPFVALSYCPPYQSTKATYIF